MQDVANPSFLKSHALYQMVDNRKLLAEKDALIAKHWDEFLDMQNKFNEANHKHNQETYLLKQQIKTLEEEKKKLQEQLQASQTSKYSNLTNLFLRIVPRVDKVLAVVQVYQMSMNDWWLLLNELWIWQIHKKERRVLGPWLNA